MKKYLLIALVLFFACTPKDEKKDESVGYSSPHAAVSAMMEAMNKQDSTALKNMLSQKTKESILSQIYSMNGFARFFSLMQGMHFSTKIIGVDSTSLSLTKVFTNQVVLQDRDTIMSMDSIVFRTTKESDGWQMISLNGVPIRMLKSIEARQDSLGGRLK